MLKGSDSSVGEWLREGPDGDVAISSRVRLARNIAGYPFLSRAGERETARIEELLRNKIMSCDFGVPLTYRRLDETDALERQVLVERHLIARDHAAADGARGVAYCARQRLSVMVNEEDHLRIQVIAGGLQLDPAWREADGADDVLGEVVPFAFNSRYGFLTACPSNVGTGMRASVMVHLPALVMAREMEKVIQHARQWRLTVRGLYGEGTHASGDLYQLSNQVSLGISEQGALGQVAEAVSSVIGLEREARDEFSRQNRAELEGRVTGALEMLGSAAAISSEEALHLISQVRLGVHLGLVRDVAPDALNEMLLLTLPAHLQTMEGRRLAGLERDTVRARRLSERLAMN